MDLILIIFPNADFKKEQNWWAILYLFPIRDYFIIIW